ncbi:hypothetical protein L2E82_27321 [Cichorium intybus]|uniref:Uncharacterized protein n=1 Tax=Cichorium intybus TaxID=13427 RepID=A0ACB9CT16_CICIN|nr:hypothetical protein L2E82_27321 [Cichorium intybus]
MYAWLSCMTFKKSILSLSSFFSFSLLLQYECSLLFSVSQWPSPSSTPLLGVAGCCEGKISVLHHKKCLPLSVPFHRCRAVQKFPHAKQYTIWIVISFSQSTHLKGQFKTHLYR